TAETTLARIVLQPFAAAGDGVQNVLSEVGGIGILEATAAREAIDQRGVQVDELSPGLAVGCVADADEQTRPGVRGRCHAPAPHLRILPAPANLSQGRSSPTSDA